MSSPKIEVYKAIGGKPLEEYMADFGPVQLETHARALEIADRADNLLRDHRVDNVAHITVTKGSTDRFVNLVDSEITNDESAGSNSALSIEFGRVGFIDPETGEKWGSMDGLYILTRAANLPKRQRAKSKRRYLSKARAMSARRARERGD